MKGLSAQLPHARGPPGAPGRGRQRAAPGRPGPALLPMVQCSPFQPGLHSHLPSRQVPCSAQRAWQARWSQAAPVQPSSQRHVPPTQTPWPPQSAAQISVGRGGEKTGVERVLLGNKGHTWLPSAGLREPSGFQRLGANPCGQGPLKE